MKKYLKIIITAAAVVAVFLCCTLQVAAASTTTYRYLTSPDQIIRLRLTDTTTSTYIDIYNPNISESSGGSSYMITYNLGLTNVDPNNVLVEILPNNDFIYNLDSSKHYTFVFEVGNQSSLSGSVDGVKMALRDTDGNYAEATGVIYTSTANTQFVSVTFTPAQINRISNITSIQIQYRYAENATSHIGVLVWKDCTVTVENPDTEQIAGIIESSTGQIVGEIQSSTDQITGSIEENTDGITGAIEDSTDEIINGWVPDPERPEGSDQVDDLTGMEDQLLQDSQQGFDEAGNLFGSFDLSLIHI